MSEHAEDGEKKKLLNRLKDSGFDILNAIRPPSLSPTVSSPDAPSRVRQPYLFTGIRVFDSNPLNSCGGLGLPGEGSMVSLNSENDFREHNMALRYRLYNRLDPGGLQLRMPDHVIPSEYFSILPFDDMKDGSGKQSSFVTMHLLTVEYYDGYVTASDAMGTSTAIGMDPIIVEFSDVCRYFLGRSGEYLSVIFSVVVLLGGIMVYWVLMSNFLYYTGSVVYVYCPKEDSSAIFDKLKSVVLFEAWFQPALDFDTVWQLRTWRPPIKQRALVIRTEKFASRNVGSLGFVVRSSTVHLVNSYDILSSRMAVFRLQLSHHKKITVSNCFFATDAPDEFEFIAFYYQLEEVIRNDKAYHKFLIEDFNAGIKKANESNYRIEVFGL
uniref:Innexin n=1 Tax=Angiostrongylus cantonensis TaxID=6313 RepID=A0A158PBN5_ANGCA